MTEMEANGQIIVKLEDKEVPIAKELIKFEKQEKKLLEEKYVPSVIEPSYGIGRIIYCIFEHCFRQREADAQRTYFAFPPSVSPVKTSLLPLISNPEMNGKVTALKKLLVRAGISSKVDDSSNTVGKRYARTDECGIPFAVTVDQRTFE